MKGHLTDHSKVILGDDAPDYRDSKEFIRLARMVRIVFKRAKAPLSYADIKRKLGVHCVDRWLADAVEKLDIEQVQQYPISRFQLRGKLNTVQFGPVPEDAQHLIVHFRIKMPDSWSAKKRTSMRGQPHRQKPDLDNLIKAVGDALLIEDKGICYIEAMKLWDMKDSISIGVK
jgi:Holliday junction resolvase RusA-like endonuclease